MNTRDFCIFVAKVSGLASLLLVSAIVSYYYLHPLSPGILLIILLLVILAKALKKPLPPQLPQLPAQLSDLSNPLSTDKSQETQCQLCGRFYWAHIGHQCVERLLVTDFQLLEDAQITRFIWSHPYLIEFVREKYELYESTQRARILGGEGVRVSPFQFPEVYSVVEQCSAVLGLPTPPEVFVIPKSTLSAYAFGSDTKFIVMQASVINKFDASELAFIIGHEIGHTLCDHVPISVALKELIQMLRRRLQELLRAAKKSSKKRSEAVIGHASLWEVFKTEQAIQDLLQMLNVWQIASELTADRAGLICSRNLFAAKKVLVTIQLPQLANKINIDEYIAQYDILERELPELAKFLPGQTHPFTVYRVRTLENWGNSPYGQFALRMAERTLFRLTCPRCKRTNREGAKFCSQCGYML